MPEQQTNISIPPSFDLPGSLLGVATAPSKPEDIISITWDNLKLIRPEWLESEDIAYEFQLFVQATYDGSKISETSYLLTALHDLLKQAPSLPDRRPDLFLDYLEMLAVLKASLLGTFTDNEVSDFLKENLLLTLKVQDFDFKDKLNELFVQARGFPVRIDDLAQQFTRAIGDNGEVLGTDAIVLRGQDQPHMPTVRNWIADYNQFSSAFTRPGEPVKRGGTERAAYITQSPNVRQLSQDERAVLLRLLEIYDWLRFGEKPLPIVGAETASKRVPAKPPVSAVPPAPAKPQIPVITPPPPPPPPPKPPVRTEPEVKPAPTFSPIAPLTPAELKREILTPELPRHEEGTLTPRPQPQAREAVAAKPPVAIKPPLAVPVAIKPPLTRPPMPAVPKPQVPAAVREPAAPVRTEVRTLDDIKYVDELKKIEVKHLRQGELVVQTAKIKSKITYLALANRLFTHQTINAFEQSPLFKTYLMMGEMLIANTDVDRKAAFEQTANKLRSSGREVLSLAEFEAVADLKKELGKM